ncbi:unnamed protein product [Paramecium sonneborni]|uniref:Uncharacterized protein n=1 Tax=Paramecium sonneborni TaxID=65129 RepID=A0A8S1NLQ9_9CILI|nr:unnamed protein product [Paramecium sonneborni]
MLKQNPILSLFQDKSDIHHFFKQYRQQNRELNYETIKRKDFHSQNRMRKLVIECGNKCEIKNKFKLNGEEQWKQIKFLQIRNCQVVQLNIPITINQKPNFKYRSLSLQQNKKKDQLPLIGWTRKNTECSQQL